MPHQEDALNRTEQFNRCAYYLDMGLGKTFVGAEKMYLLNNSVNVVICQKSKIDDWVQHFKEYYPSDRVMNLTKKSEAINFRTLVDTKELYNKDVQIIGVINYETAFRRDWLLKLKGFTLMLDESSLISCNMGVGLYDAVSAVPTHPFQNNQCSTAIDEQFCVPWLLHWCGVFPFHCTLTVRQIHHGVHLKQSRFSCHVWFLQDWLSHCPEPLLLSYHYTNALNVYHLLRGIYVFYHPVLQVHQGGQDY